MKIRVSPLVFLMAAVLVATGFYVELLSYLSAIIMHELVHAYVAAKRGYALTEIKLMPYGASLKGAYEGVKRGDEIVIALAGPLSNAVAALVFVALWWIFPSVYIVSEIFVYCNVTNAVFNLIPIYPLDGGRILLAFVSKWVKREKAYRYMRIIGGIAAVIFSGLFIMSVFFGLNFSYMAIAVFMLSSTLFPEKNSQYQRLYSMAYRSQKLKSGLEIKTVAVDKDCTVLRLHKMLNANYFYRFSVLDSGFRELGVFSETELEDAAGVLPIDGTAFDVLKSRGGK